MEKNKKKKTTDKSVALLALRGPWVTSLGTSFLYFLTPPKVWPEPAPVLSFSTGSDFVADSSRCSGSVLGTSLGSTSSSEISWRGKTFCKNYRIEDKTTDNRITTGYRQNNFYQYRIRNPWNPTQDQCSTLSSAEQSSSPRHYCPLIFCRVATCLYLYPVYFCSADDRTNSP